MNAPFKIRPTILKLCLIFFKLFKNKLVDFLSEAVFKLKRFKLLNNFRKMIGHFFLKKFIKKSLKKDKNLSFGLDRRV